MRAVIQRVKNARVEVEGKIKGEIEKGFLILLGVEKGDTDKDLEIMVRKCANMRVFKDENEKMNLSLNDVDAKVLVISNFTLYADCKKGNRPSFTDAAGGEFANEMYERFCSLLKSSGGLAVEKGVFGADMQVSLINDGPVTIILDSKELLK